MPLLCVRLLVAVVLLAPAGVAISWSKSRSRPFPLATVGASLMLISFGVLPWLSLQPLDPIGLEWLGDALPMAGRLLALLGALAGWWPVRWQWGVYVAFTLLATVSMVRWTRVVRERFVREAALPQFLQRKLRETYPALSAKDCELVERGLRQFFLACLRSDKNFVAMPSQAVDAMWHAFILHTRAYKSWCDNALGFFLDHTPAEVLGKKARHNDGLRRAWYWACKDEAINPRTPSRLPLLFALDAKLDIPGGFHYAPDCANLGPGKHPHHDGGRTYFGTSFSDGSFTGSADDFGGMDSADASAGDGGAGDGGGNGCGGGGSGGD